MAPAGMGDNGHRSGTGDNYCCGSEETGRCSSLMYDVGGARLAVGALAGRLTSVCAQPETIELEESEWVGDEEEVGQRIHCCEIIKYP